VSNRSERGTGGGEARDMRAGGGMGASPRKFENLDTLCFIFPAFQCITNCMIECALYDMSGVDFAGDTISIVHRDRKVEVAPYWATVYFQICS